MGEEILISIVIPVKNGGYWLQNALEGIRKQTLFNRCEIIIIDSGSTDDTFAILENFDVKVIKIEGSAFNHGTTRNLGAQHAQGEFVVMTVQDAWPADERWLEGLLSCFDSDRVAGVCGQQIVPHRSDMNPIQWFRPISAPEIRRVHFSSAVEYYSLSPFEKRAACGWDNVNAMYRRASLLAVPFRHIMFGEDAQWAIDVLLKGYELVYNPSARVYHYHYEVPDFTYKRVFAEYYTKYQLFGCTYSTEAIMLPIMRNAKALLKERSIGFIDKIKWLIYNAKLRDAGNRAIREFNKHRSKGKDALDAAYVSICKGSPIAPAPTK